MLIQKDVIIIGGGQSGLSTAYFLRRTGLDYLILDAFEQPGGAWQKGWDSLRLFSPATFSSLPGVIMPGGGEYYPSKEEVVTYLSDYENRYQFPIERPVKVESVEKSGNEFMVRTDKNTYQCKALIAASGNFSKPFIPDIEGVETFEGIAIHSSQYKNEKPFKNKKVMVVGEGNSGAQIASELVEQCQLTWATSKEPIFLPEHIDGRYLFDTATKVYHESIQKREPIVLPSLGDIVMVPSVKAAHDKGLLKSVRPFSRVTSHGVIWPDGIEERFDAIIYCTGFHSAIDYLKPLGITNAEGRIETKGSKALRSEGLWLVGFGNWTGFASATLIGVGRSARQAVEEIKQYFEH